MKDLLMGCLSVALFFTAACSQPVPHKVSPGVAVSKLDCARGSGSQTQVGDVKLTAYHVAYACRVNGIDYGEMDLTILDPGSGTLPTCRRPNEGERLQFDGFPGMTENRTVLSNQRMRPAETDSGVVVDVNTSVESVQHDGSTSTYKGGSFAVATRVRSGYSGGSVISAETGEFLGIISSAAEDGSAAYFVSAAQICQALKEVKT